MEINDITYKIIGCAYKVHLALGPGLLESTYEICMVHELVNCGLKVEQQKALPITYNGIKLNAAYRIDLLIQDSIIVELKVVEAISNIHKAQVLSYLKLSKLEVGLLINFNVTDMKKGVTRLISSKTKSYV